LSLKNRTNTSVQKLTNKITLNVGISPLLDPSG
jgi:hypothetical protein